jgi:hypothetical protein
MAFGEVNFYIILVHNKHTPTDEEWSEYIQFNLARGTAHGVLSRFLVVTEGGSPSSAQRKAMHDTITPILKKKPTVIRSAIVTPSTFVRGVVTAMHLINPIFKAFSPGDMKEAYAYLGIPPAYFGEIEAMTTSLKAQLRH